MSPTTLKFPDALRHKNERYFAQFEQCWREKCHDDLIPTKDQIDPMEMPRLLPYLQMLEVIDAGRDFRIRLSGEMVNEAYGFSLRGKLMSAFLPQEKSPGSWESLRNTVETRTPNYHSANNMSVVGRDFVSFIRLAVPLSNNGNQVDYILSMFAYEYVRERLN